ncbi:MAG: NADH-ubiquinone oxidoreductase-F iron-sulfur binding region domain-containing protein [Cyanobacteriota bacterium]
MTKNLNNNNNGKFYSIFDFVSDKNHISLLDFFSKKTGRTFSNVEKVNKYFEELRHKDVLIPHIFVGVGTCGLGAGAGKTLTAIKEYLIERKIEAKIVEVGCIGLCYEEPIVDIQLPGYKRISFGSITSENVEAVLDKIFDHKVEKDHVLYQYSGENLTEWPDVLYNNEHPFLKKQTRWVLSNCGIIIPANIQEYIAFSGYSALVKTLNEHKPEIVCNIVEKSGLRGRGGGGFTTGKKWKFALNNISSKKYLICNADEGDPGAFMDRAVIEGDPHRLIEGIIISSYAIGANIAYVYIRAEYPLAIRNLEKAIEEASAWGFLGKNILGTNFDLNIIIKKGAGAFVCGEETALIHSIEGKRGMPRPRPPFPAIQGLFGHPTVINNVETLANIPKILLEGSDAFAHIGTSNSKGTKVFALSGKVKRTGLVEVKMGTKIRDIVFDIGGGITNDYQFKAVQIGGPSGGCVPEKHLDIKIDYESLKTIGAMMGSGGLVVMDENNCMVDVAKFFMEFIQRESCGKCIPCREGTKRMLEILQSITRGKQSEKGVDALERFKGVIQLEQLAKVIQETSLCGLGQTAPNPVLSTLRWFRDEYDEHIYERTCHSEVCQELITYNIDSDNCKGCTLCAKKCPNDAIVGKPKETHYILQNKCLHCGVCADVCRFDAVVKS